MIIHWICLHLKVIERTAVDHPHHTLFILFALANAEKDAKYLTTGRKNTTTSRLTRNNTKEAGSEFTEVSDVIRGTTRTIWRYLYYLSMITWAYSEKPECPKRKSKLAFRWLVRMLDHRGAGNAWAYRYCILRGMKCSRNGLTNVSEDMFEFKSFCRSEPTDVSWQFDMIWQFELISLLSAISALVLNSLTLSHLNKVVIVINTWWCSEQNATNEEFSIKRKPAILHANIRAKLLPSGPLAPSPREIFFSGFPGKTPVEKKFGFCLLLQIARKLVKRTREVNQNAYVAWLFNGWFIFYGACAKFKPTCIRGIEWKQRRWQ